MLINERVCKCNVGIGYYESYFEQHRYPRQKENRFIRHLVAIFLPGFQERHSGDVLSWENVMKQLCWSLSFREIRSLPGVIKK